MDISGVGRKGELLVPYLGLIYRLSRERNSGGRSRFARQDNEFSFSLVLLRYLCDILVEISSGQFTKWVYSSSKRLRLDISIQGLLMLLKDTPNKQTGLLVCIGQIAFSLEQYKRRLTKFFLLPVFPADCLSSFRMFFFPDSLQYCALQSGSLCHM